MLLDVRTLLTTAAGRPLAKRLIRSSAEGYASTRRCGRRRRRSMHFAAAVRVRVTAAAVEVDAHVEAVVVADSNVRLNATPPSGPTGIVLEQLLRPPMYSGIGARAHVRRGEVDRLCSVAGRASGHQRRGQRGGHPRPVSRASALLVDSLAAARWRRAIAAKRSAIAHVARGHHHPGQSENALDAARLGACAHRHRLARSSDSTGLPNSAWVARPAASAGQRSRNAVLSVPPSRLAALRVSSKGARSTSR